MNKKLFLSLFIVLLCINVFSDGISQNLFNTLFSENTYETQKIFTSDFVDAVSEVKIREIIQGVISQLGDFRYFDKKSNVLFFEKGEMKVFFQITDNRFSALNLAPPKLYNDSIDTIIVEFKDIPEFSICIIKNNKDIIFDINKDKKLGVGSSFKLYVLKTLSDIIDQRKTSWSRTLYLSEKDKSLPSGIIQNWPVLSPITLRTLSNLMISVSDNTATDMLIDYVGRENIQKITPEKNDIILKTSEMFKLKLSKNSEISEKYISGSYQEKLKIIDSLKKIDLPSLEIASQWNKPINIEEIEWFFSTRELCSIIYSLRKCQSLRINNSGLVTDKWDYVGFKGGSEPGVLNMTYVLKKGQNIYTISITGNNSHSNIDTMKFSRNVSRILNILYNEEI